MARPIPHGLLTLEEWEALPEDNSAHYELQWGVPIVSPKPARRHQDALLGLGMQVRQQLPKHLQALIDFEVVVRSENPATVRAPDLIVVPRGGPELRVPAGEVQLVVEIISSGSRNIDANLKAFEYAEAGIPWYWIVDLDPPAPSITVFGLGAPGDGYRESQTATGELIVTEPAELRIDIDALVEPW